MKRVIWLALFVCMVLSLWGKIRLPSILGDNMVLQRSDTVNIWGWAAPSQNVTVKPSWDNRIYTTKAENNGKWLLQIQTPEAGEYGNAGAWFLWAACSRIFGGNS